MKPDAIRRHAFTRRPLTLAVAALFPLGSAVAAEPAVETTLPRIDVVAVAPLPGLDQPRDRIPSNVQTTDAAALRAKQSIALPDFLGDRLPGVNINEIQGNPFQPDVNYRGFSASPLLGTPQGLSVYLDGVRVNEPFGDTVNWDLIPQLALDSVTLLPGSNPLYGLNTLGGALALRTKNGFDHPGGEAQVMWGSFERRSLEVEHGGSHRDTGYYVAANLFEEDGWRDRSPSEVRQFFGKLTQRFERGELDLTLMHADTDLTGNGLAPESMLERRREIFTHPDNTRNDMGMVALSGRYWIDERNTLSASVYHRETLTRTLNGDGNDDFEEGPNDGDCDPGDFDAGSAEEAQCAAAGAAGGINAETGVNNRTRNKQRARGLALQWSHEGERNQFAVGFSHDRSNSRFTQTSQLGLLDASRGVMPTDDIELENSLDGETRSSSVYVTDTFALTPALHLTASARYNHTRIINSDRLDPTPPNLDGDFTYRKLNPALGLTWQANDRLTVYGGYSQGNRAPSPIELGCADPANPCTLPNALAADPFLKQVVTRTLELGVRGSLLGDSLRWNAGVYRSVNHDDILFVGTSTSAGYFTNFGRTRRQGAELGLSGKHRGLDWALNYNYVQATFQSSACILAENNSSRGQSAKCTDEGQDDEILVKRGDRMPGIPAHSLKLMLSWQATEALRVGADFVAFSSQYARGNENNRHREGEVTDAFGETRNFEGSGKMAGYSVLNLNADYTLGGGWTLFGRINNVFDRKYSTGGALAENPFDAGGTFQTDSGDWARETFYAPGAPRAGWIGLRYRWGA